jgi:SEL1 protein
MYTLNAVDSFHISEPKDIYIYDILPVAAGLAAISSDNSLRLLDPLALSGTPLNSIRRLHTDVTCLNAVNTTTEGDALIVCTAGRDGRVCLLDPRTSAIIGEARTGELNATFFLKYNEWC